MSAVDSQIKSRNERIPVSRSFPPRGKRSRRVIHSSVRKKISKTFVDKEAAIIMTVLGKYSPIGADAYFDRARSIRVSIEKFQLNKVTSVGISELEKISLLKQGWDSYDAPPIPKSVISTGRRIVEFLDNSSALRLQWVVPTGDRSLLLQFEVQNRTVKLEIDADGDIGVMIKNAYGEPEYYDTDAYEVVGFLIEHLHDGVDL